MAQEFCYLDYAASAPERPETLEAQQAYYREPYAGANPNSLHTLGRMAARALDGARKDLATAVGSGFRPADLTFTSGGTESNNLAVLGISEGVRSRDKRRNTVVLSAIEHDSIVDLAPQLKGEGFEVRTVRPQRDGRVHGEDLKPLLDESVALVSVMYANNETGVIQPIDELAGLAHEVGALFHTDAVQAFARVPLQLEKVDAVSIAGHKIGAPIGIGALLLRPRIPLKPRAIGGGQESGRRSGTQDVCDALAFAACARKLVPRMAETRALVARRAQKLVERLTEGSSRILQTVDTPMAGERLPGTVSLLIRDVDSESLVLQLDQAGFEVSAASACSSGSLDPSHVLSAMGIERTLALGSLRVSFDERVSEDDLSRFAEVLIDIVEKF